ncbi:hypothetical protein NQ315_014934 [Exocentrus adspersus]|uniref:RNase H type-1 domain-containing protein n=1 Tax=Exocentrus adspersus TaxID=1586481 RepID=A0AAV8VAH7_9CUCU|nr:hypothetical protein NQ315_014934 [Exocentrus adspersus]
MPLHLALSRAIDALPVEGSMPRFNEFRLTEQGIIMVTCFDERSKEWLTSQVGSMSPFRETGIRILEGEALPRLRKMVAFVPGPSEEGVDLLRRIERSTPELRTRFWKIRQVIGVPGRGTRLILGVDEESAVALQRLNFVGHAGMSRVTFWDPRHHKGDPGLTRPPNRGSRGGNGGERFPGFGGARTVTSSMANLNASSPLSLKCTQINLQHCIAATSLISQQLAAGHTHAVLIQEPWVGQGSVKGLSRKWGHVYVSSDQTPRACIYTSKQVTATKLTNFCFRDLVAIKVTVGRSCYILCSAYLPYESPTPPPRQLMELVEWCKSNNLPLIVGCDANAHHTCWGSKDVNQRGQDLLEFLISSGLDILNRGTKPTFVTRNRQEVIDITISNSWSSHLVTNWRVSSEVSMSDHRHILFNLETGTVPVEREYRNPKLTVWSTYKDILSRNVGPPVRPHTIPQIESSVKNLTKAVVHAYEQSCPVRKWRGRVQDGGHVSALNQLVERDKLLEAPSDKIPLTYVFKKIIQLRSQAEKSGTGTLMLSCHTGSSGSQMGPKHLRAEVFAISACVSENLKRGYSNQHIQICTDSQAALHALKSPRITSQVVLECTNSLAALGQKNKVRLVWVPGHSGVAGNEEADVLARKGSSDTLTGPEPAIGLPYSYPLGSIDNWTREKCQGDWSRGIGLRQARLLIKGPGLSAARLKLAPQWKKKKKKKKRLREESTKQSATDIDLFEIGGQEIVAIYDPPHLLKGIRNNMIVSDVKFAMDDVQQKASWQDIIDLYKLNEGDFNTRMCYKLTDSYIYKEKIKEDESQACCPSIFSSRIFDDAMDRKTWFWTTRNEQLRYCRLSFVYGPGFLIVLMDLPIKRIMAKY